MEPFAHLQVVEIDIGADKLRGRSRAAGRLCVDTFLPERVATWQGLERAIVANLPIIAFISLWLKRRSIRSHLLVGNLALKTTLPSSGLIHGLGKRRAFGKLVARTFAQATLRLCSGR